MPDLTAILRRIQDQTADPGLFSILAERLAPSDLQSLLIAVYQARARSLKPAAVRRHTALTAASDVDARLLHRFDRAAFTSAADFEAVDLAPVCPLGLEHVLGGIDQNNVLTTIRNVEVLGDSTPALALECVRRRAGSRGDTVRLCASQRVVRLQPFDFAGFTPHFRLFALVSAGRDMGSQAFETAELARHIAVYLRLFRALNDDGFSLAEPLVELTDLAITERLLGEARHQVRAAVRAHRPGSSERFLAERGISLPESDPAMDWLDKALIEPLKAEYPEARFRFNLARLEGLGYYSGLSLRISPLAADGRRYPVGDGGFTTWTARLLADRKQRLLISGIGSEFVCRRYLGAGAHSLQPTPHNPSGELS